MNKKTKGLIAGALGAGLLLGAGGTFALWFDTTALGENPDQIATGTLSIGDTDIEGRWFWTRVSHPDSADLVDKAVTFEQGLLVPGDQITWEWTKSDIELFLAGDTIRASIFLDEVEIPAEVLAGEYAPLQFTFNDGTYFAFDDATSSFVPAAGIPLLTADSVEDFNFDEFTLPYVVVNFPIDPQVNEGTAGIGHDEGYGRDFEDITVIDLSQVQIRLQQIVPALS